MEVGASGRRGSHAAWRVEVETGHVLAHALIQRQNGTGWIALGRIPPQRAVICTIVKVGLWNSKTSIVFTAIKAFMTWIVSSNNQWMEVGASGRRGSHAAWRVEVETGHVLAHALIQRQNGTGWIALGRIPPQRAVICTIVKVGLWNSKTSIVFTAIKAFMTWIVSSNNQWMEVGASGRRGSHAAWRVEVETGHALARALIQCQHGRGWIALEQITP